MVENLSLFAMLLRQLPYRFFPEGRFPTGARAPFIPHADGQQVNLPLGVELEVGSSGNRLAPFEALVEVGGGGGTFALPLLHCRIGCVLLVSHERQIRVVSNVTELYV